VELKPLCWQAAARTHVQVHIQIQHKKVGVQAKQLSRRKGGLEEAAEASLGHV
jgi:molybdenum cofactor biosynthesis enzyme